MQEQPFRDQVTDSIHARCTCRSPALRRDHLSTMTWDPSRPSPSRTPG